MSPQFPSLHLAMSYLADGRNSPGSVNSSSASPGGTGSSIEGNSHGAPSEERDSNALAKVQSAPTKTSNAQAKTDKPRPHICGTCQRSFARLEHLKRHERSHTKEKPFACPECTRCFARRDLLLRHQQKLHLNTTPTSGKGGKARRDSVSSTAGVNPSAKIRKASTAAAPQAISARPRANTISHVDGGTLGMLAGLKGGSRAHQEEGGKRVDYSQFVNAGGGQSSFHLRNASNGAAAPHGGVHNLPRLATHGLSHAHGGGEAGLRTAPPMSMSGAFGFPHSHPDGSTVNPAQLHMGDGSDGGGFLQMDGAMMVDDEDGFDWMRGFSSQMNFQAGGDQAMAASSPSVLSLGSVNGVSDRYMSGSPNVSWQAGVGRDPRFAVDGGMAASQEHALSMDPMTPHGFQSNASPEHFYPTPPHVSSLSPQSAANGYPPQMGGHVVYGSDGTSVSSASISGSAHSSNTTCSIESITEVTRQALLLSLSQPSAFGQRKYPQPTVSSPLRDASKSAVPGANLPSTADLQRYVGAYITYFHPHFPFLHIPTLSFDTPAYTSNLRFAASPGQVQHGNIVGGGGCLVLAMAAIGALYEQQYAAGKELFDSAKKMIQLYLEERRKADSAGKGGAAGDPGTQHTPLWLVQAMLLNVIYGHNCGDKISGDIASTHCSALVSLARAAGLLVPLPEGSVSAQAYYNGHRLSPIGEMQASDYVTFSNPFGQSVPVYDESAQWHRWVVVEERKRTLYAIFHMSSLLVSAYNHAPALMNSEIQLDLPCEEELWCAGNAAVWMSKGGVRGAEQGGVRFSLALGVLLNANQNHGEPHSMSAQQPFGSGVAREDVPPSTLRPSTWGCLALINALHNYIWETRQRHSGREWTTQETESMHAHIEPALRAWQAAWASNPTHSLERPNPYGLGPLSADCIPLLDLAYVRLFVNLGMSKEAFWQRDFDAMSEELARGTEIIQHADNSANGTALNTADVSRNSPDPSGGGDPSRRAGGSPSQSSKRERHLRKAAFYAADSLSMSDKLGVTFADFTSRELPLQAGLCTFDCAQILAEWVSTVQERVGRYLGVLGKDRIDYSNVPAIMLLEDEDCKLLEKIADILGKVEVKMMSYISNNMSGPAAMQAMQSLPSVCQKGFGSKILSVTAYMFERAAIWPVTNTMAQCLSIQAAHMQRRAENSTKTGGEVGVE